MTIDVVLNMRLARIFRPFLEILCDRCTEHLIALIAVVFYCVWFNVSVLFVRHVDGKGKR
jgi:hypothetical protein